MSMKFKLAVLLGAVGLAACSVVEERQQAYRHAESAPVLVMPASLDRPNTESALVVPHVGDYEPPNAEPPLFEQTLESN